MGASVRACDRAGHTLAPAPHWSAGNESTCKSRALQRSRHKGARDRARCSDGAQLHPHLRRGMRTVSSICKVRDVQSAGSAGLAVRKMEAMNAAKRRAFIVLGESHSGYKHTEYK